MSRLRKGCLLSLLAIVAIGLSGCLGSGGGNSPSANVPKSDKALVKVSIDWEGFGSLTPGASRTKGVTQADITHVGARLEYPSKTDAFVQSVKREGAEDTGTLTMEVSATDRADLYLAAVRYDGTPRGNRAYYLGVVRGLSLQGGALVDIKMDDIDWVETSWRVSEEDELTWNKGDRLYEASALQHWFDKPVIYVRDPFQIGENPSYDESLLGIWGCSKMYENGDGWRRFEVSADNERLGEECITQHTFWPFVYGEAFGLPLTGGGYLIEPVDNTYQIHWKL